MAKQQWNTCKPKLFFQTTVARGFRKTFYASFSGIVFPSNDRISCMGESIIKTIICTVVWKDWWAAEFLSNSICFKPVIFHRKSWYYFWAPGFFLSLDFGGLVSYKTSLRSLKSLRHLLQRKESAVSAMPTSFSAKNKIELKPFARWIFLLKLDPKMLRKIGWENAWKYLQNQLKIPRSKSLGTSCVLSRRPSFVFAALVFWDYWHIFWRRRRFFDFWIFLIALQGGGHPTIWPIFENCHFWSENSDHARQIPNFDKQIVSRTEIWSIFKVLVRNTYHI